MKTSMTANLLFQRRRTCSSEIRDCSNEQDIGGRVVWIERAKLFPSKFIQDVLEILDHELGAFGFRSIVVA